MSLISVTFLFISLVSLGAQAAGMCRQYFPKDQRFDHFMGQITKGDTQYVSFQDAITNAPEGAKNERTIEAQLRITHLARIEADQKRLEKAIQDKKWDEVRRLIDLTDANFGSWAETKGQPHLVDSSPFEAIYKDHQGRKKLGLWMAQHPKFITAIRDPNSDFRFILHRLLDDLDRDWYILRAIVANPAVDINISRKQDIVAGALPRWKGYRTPLIAAIEAGASRFDRKGLDQIIDLILTRKDVKVELTDEKGRGALMHMFMARFPSEVILKYISDLRFPINQIDSTGKSLLDYAVERGESSLIQAIIGRSDFDSSARSKNGKGAMMNFIAHTRFAAVYDSFSHLILKIVSLKDFNINEVDDLGNSILDYAIHTGDPQYIRTVVNNPNFDLSKQNSHGKLATNNILYLKDYNQATLKAIDSGFDVNARGANGQTFLIQAIRANNLVVAKKIIEREDTELLLQDKDGKDAFIHALDRGLVDIIRQLWPKFSYAQQEFYKDLYVRSYLGKPNRELHVFFAGQLGEQTHPHLVGLEIDSKILQKNWQGLVETLQRNPHYDINDYRNGDKDFLQILIEQGPSILPQTLAALVKTPGLSIEIEGSPQNALRLGFSTRNKNLVVLLLEKVNLTTDQKIEFLEKMEREAHTDGDRGLVNLIRSLNPNRRSGIMNWLFRGRAG